jgi:hypothetical protein
MSSLGQREQGMRRMAFKEYVRFEIGKTARRIKGFPDHETRIQQQQGVRRKPADLDCACAA